MTWACPTAARAVLHTRLAGLRGDMMAMENRLMADVHAEIVTSMRWTLGMFLTVQTIVIGLVLAFS